VRNEVCQAYGKPHIYTYMGHTYFKQEIFCEIRWQVVYTYILVNFSGIVENYGTSQYKANGRILSLQDDNV